jgi:hypothetical protein
MEYEDKDEVVDSRNKETAMKITGIADDIFFVLKRGFYNNVCMLEITDTGVDAPDYNPDKNFIRITLTEVEASAIVALFIGIGESGLCQKLVKMLYEIAEPVLSDVPSNLRIIP